ncbi:MAG: xanthine dehydrogenase family protein subunit M [Betaproteobacteria bacterium]|jgi:carbon-monoxide dehydrogenase medium subunit|nr:xanthine dehydrogenase family protein subunit M [Betaproteobacteria bacterium]
MKAGSFEWHPARSADEAVALLAQYAPQDGRVIAGGQSLVPSMALRLAFPSHLIDINGVDEFAKVRVEGGELVIGACVRHAAFHVTVEPGPLGRLLVQVVHDIAHYPIRQRGTFCGSLANADPASEWCLVAAVLGAKMVARSARGTRVIPAADWFQGIMTTALAEDELLAEVRLPLLPAGTRAGFYEFSRRAGDYALAMALVSWRDDGDAMRDVRIGAGAVEAQPRRIAEAEALLEGHPFTPAAIEAAAAAASAAVDPLEDVHTSAEYRRDLVGTAVRRAFAQAGS